VPAGRTDPAELPGLPLVDLVHTGLRLAVLEPSS
jgi:hypothetical protein